MSRILFMLLLFLVSSDALAEWIIVGGNEYSTIFADPTSVLRVGNIAKMLSLYDTDIAQVVGSISFMSSKTLDEYDCKENQSRTLAFYWYSGHMGEGNILYGNTDPRKWSPVIPKSMSETLWKFVCDKK
jgi:Surface-adhesin protein E